MSQIELFTLNSVDKIELEAAIHLTKKSRPIGNIIQAHGITVDMNEGGMFVRLAEGLAETGFNVLRFSFRGHGKSGGTQKGVTIAGEMLDLQAAIDYVTSRFSEPLSIVAASFGSVSTSLSLPFIEHRLKSLVLWNPVLDMNRTFIQPELPWGKKNFNLHSIEQLKSQGYFLLEQEFEIGWVLFEEMKNLDPYSCFKQSLVPSIIIHGDRDSYVPYNVSANIARNRRNCGLFTINNSDHGFDSKEREDQAINITINFFDEIYKRDL
jgi:uncharacterized protein